MAERQKDGFFKNVNSFFKKIQKDDTLRLGDGKVSTLDVPKDENENKKSAQFQVFRQYLQQKNYSTQHIELYNEYRKMDDTFPIANAALRLYGQEICISGNSVLRTPQGDLSINELVKKGFDKNFFMLQVFDPTYKRTVWGMAKYIKSMGVKKVFKVTIEKKLDEETLLIDLKEPSFVCTDNHKIMVANKMFKELKDLKVGDEIFSLYKYTDPDCKCLKDVFQSSKIIKIEEAGEEEVFDLINVEPYPHFSIKVSDYMYVEVHNCTKGDDGNIIKINHPNKEVKKALEDCFFKKLKINSQGYLIIKEMLKFGNTYTYINARRGEGVVDLIYLPPESMRIELLQTSNNLDDFRYSWMGGQGGSSNWFEPWEVVHFKIIEDIALQPYGTSIFKSVVDTWRRIILMREAIIIYRITRAPQRYLFKIDTSGLSGDEALAYADQVQKSLYKKPSIDPKTNMIDFKSNVLSIEENLFLPTFSGDESGVEVLQGASNMNDLEDYKIIKDDFFAGLLIPKAFLSFEENLCVRYNTIIHTSDGLKTIKEISEEFSNFENKKKKYIICCNEFGYITTGKILWCKPTKTVSELHKITLSNDKVIECTDNHPFLLESLEYKKAHELKIGDQLKGIYHNEIFVKEIEILQLEEPELVYDLEVEEIHNFGVEAGIFIHNSNKAVLKSEDLRFGNAVKQYQSFFIEGLLHIAVVHLHLQGFSQEDIEMLEIEMNVSSQELKKMEMEVMQQKVELAKSILDTGNGELTLMSFTQVLKDVLDFTDEDIKITFEDQLIEKKMNWRMSELKTNGFYEEPEFDKKNALEKKYGESENIFSKILFEKTEISNSFRSILSKKAKEDVKKLIESRRFKVDSKNVSKLIKNSSENHFKKDFLKDIGIK